VVARDVSEGGEAKVDTAQNGIGRVFASTAVGLLFSAGALYLAVSE
jgi:hypothetical protein